MSYTEKNITTLTGLQHLKFRSQMYGFSGFGKAGILLLCKEILDNAIDELGLDQNRPHQLDLMFVEKRNTFQCVIRDTGRGVPLGKLKPVYTDTNTSGKWGESYGFSIGANGVGAKGTVALSTHFAAVSRRKEGTAKITTEQTKITSHQIDKSKSYPDSGTTVFFEPDFSIMKNAQTFFKEDGGYQDFLDLISFMAVNLPNTTIQVFKSTSTLSTENFKEKSADELWELLTPKGTLILSPAKNANLLTYLLGPQATEANVLWNSGLLEKHGLKVPVTVQTGLERKHVANMGYKIQFLLTRDSTIQGRTQLLSAVNLVRMYGRTSSHVSVATTRIKKHIHPFVDAKYQEFFLQFYPLPLHLIVLVNWQHAVFVNQDKSDFVDDDFAKGFEEALAEEFTLLGDERWIELANLLEEDIKLKWSRKHKKDLGLSSDSKNLAFSLHNPRCYYECRRTGAGTELLICEGVSSGDYVKQLRNSETQAVFELKGKILNPFKKGDSTLDGLKQNHVISDLLQVLGTSPEDKNLEHFRFDKIGILADADSDGNHITTLVLSDLYHINPQLFEQERVFVLNPPLYVINLQKTKNEPFFVRDHSSLLRFQAMVYATEFNIAIKIGSTIKKVSNEDYYSICCVILHLGDLLKDVGIKQHVDPGLLEMLVYCLSELQQEDSQGVASKLSLDNARFDNTTKTLYLETDGYETIVPTNGLVQEIEQRLLPEFNKFNLFQLEFILTSISGNYYDNTSVSVMMLYNVFKQMDTLYRIRRMKGIGEMDKKHLIQTCLNPETRTFTTIKGIGDFQRVVELMSTESEARKKLVMNYVRQE